MVDVEARPAPAEDRGTRSAAIWATVVAVPVAVIVALVIFLRVVPESPVATPAPSATQPAVVPSAPVPMAAPKLPARAAEVCLAVTSQLPAKVRDLAPRQVSAGPEQNAAYGEPPLTVACGVAQPRTCVTPVAGCIPLDTELLVMDRVCWYADQQPAATIFTTMDREIPVQVTVPKQYEPSGQWANEFSTVVVETDKSITEGVPAGCL